MFEMIDYDNRKWRVVGKVEGNRIDDHTKLKSNYGCDLVLKNSQNVFFMLDEIIDVKFEDI